MRPNTLDKEAMTIETMVSDMIGQEGRLSKLELLIERIDRLAEILRADNKQLLTEFFNFRLEIKQELVRIERGYKNYFWLVITSLSTLVAFLQMIIIHWQK